MLLRKLDNFIEKHYENNKSALLLKGARQVGKTSASTEYAQRYMTLSSYWDKLADYFVTWINDSPNAVDSSAIERRVKFGNPVVHLETTASLLPIFLAKSRWLIFFSLRIESMRAIMSADNWISVRISAIQTKALHLSKYYERIGTEVAEIELSFSFPESYAACLATLTYSFHHKRLVFRSVEPFI